MFILDPSRFSDFDLRNGREFVQYWQQYYRQRVTVFGANERINYFAEIDPTRPLTFENVRRLLRWIVAASSLPTDSQLEFRKQTDDALFAFGQFLKRYWPRPTIPRA